MTDGHSGEPLYADDAMAQGENIVPLFSARARNRLAESLGALDGELTADDLAAIDDAIPPVGLGAATVPALNPTR